MEDEEGQARLALSQDGTGFLVPGRLACVPGGCLWEQWEQNPIRRRDGKPD